MGVQTGSIPLPQSGWSELLQYALCTYDAGLTNVDYVKCEWLIL